MFFPRHSRGTRERSTSSSRQRQVASARGGLQDRQLPPPSSCLSCLSRLRKALRRSLPYSTKSHARPPVSTANAQAPPRSSKGTLDSGSASFQISPAAIPAPIPTNSIRIPMRCFIGVPSVVEVSSTFSETRPARREAQRRRMRQAAAWAPNPIWQPPEPLQLFRHHFHQRHSASAIH